MAHAIQNNDALDAGSSRVTSSQSSEQFELLLGRQDEVGLIAREILSIEEGFTSLTTRIREFLAR